VHLKDRYFCSPIIDEEAAKAKRERELAEEKEKVLKEYEERQKKKKEKEDKDKNKDADKDKDKDKDDKDDKKEEKKPEDDSKVRPEPLYTTTPIYLTTGLGIWNLNSPGRRAQGIRAQEVGQNFPFPSPLFFQIIAVDPSSSFYQQRLQKRRQAEAAKRDRERVAQPGYFPSVPTDLPGK
jgi:hypothetical protein